MLRIASAKKYSQLLLAVIVFIVMITLATFHSTKVHALTACPTSQQTVYTLRNISSTGGGSAYYIYANLYSFSTDTSGTCVAKQISSVTYENGYNEPLDFYSSNDRIILQQDPYSIQNTSSTKGTTKSGSIITVFRNDSGNIDPLVALGVTAAKTTNSQPAQGTSSCNVSGGISWILCPVVNSAATATDAAYSYISKNYLEVKPAMFADKTTQDVWGMVRNVANTGLVFVFLAIIFSQISSIGISNYGVKKMLPRLIIAAILINLSYYISEIAVDLSNILGQSLISIFQNINTALYSTSSDGLFSNSYTWSNIATTVLAAGGITGAVAGAGGAWPLLILLGPVLLSVLVAIIVIFLILVARQAIILILIIVSPIAFLAYLLPNTESWFTKWRKTLTAMLMVYPVISFVIAGSQIASKIITGSSTDTAMQIIGAGVSILPLFIVPGLLKSSLNAIPAIGKLANRMSSNANGRIGKRAQEGYRASDFNKKRTVRKSQLEKRRATEYAQRMLGEKTKIPRPNQILIDRSKAKDTILRNARATMVQAEAEELKNSQSAVEFELNAKRAEEGSSFNEKKWFDKYINNKEPGNQHSEESRIAAMHMAGARGYDGVLRAVRNDPKTTGAMRIGVDRAISANVGSLMSKSPDFFKGDAAFENMNGTTLSGLSGDGTAAYMNYLSRTIKAGRLPLASAKEIEAAAKASSDFNTALETIQQTPALKSDWKADKGAVLHDAIRVSPELQATIGDIANLRIDPTTGNWKP